jgi:hypothetical protein
MDFNRALQREIRIDSNADFNFIEKGSKVWQAWPHHRPRILWRGSGQQCSQKATVECRYLKNVRAGCGTI